MAARCLEALSRVFLAVFVLCAFLALLAFAVKVWAVLLPIMTLQLATDTLLSLLPAAACLGLLIVCAWGADKLRKRSL